MPARHEKLSQALSLILSLSTSQGGLTVREMMAIQGCGRRTIERLLKAIDQVCRSLEQVPSAEREKRWRLGPTPLAWAVAISLEEVAEIEAAAHRLDGEGLRESAGRLRSASRKLRARDRADTMPA
ncbi:hypothetical protein C8P66_12120 [Humitalea rosea]|uniref:Uncharacterized protein n=1 Tax=Humitalea rosea TaxID=990373 RepID=A0A2W7IRQ1_9PROT|nr:hypothetical protein [Humitalea rosea]PZW41313.1 hypothetical protein C8P66_12120 [Humitalea rosea]